MRVEVNGLPYEYIQEITVQSRIDTLCSTFSFRAALTANREVPFTVNDSVVITVDGDTVLTGYIDVVNIDMSDAGTSAVFQGRDKTSDILDSSIDQINSITGAISLSHIIRLVLKSLGSTIEVIDNVKPALFKPTVDNISPEPGDNVFYFLEKLARQRQVILSTTPDGNMVIESIPGGTSDGFLQRLEGNQSNNILSASYTVDDSQRFYRYKYRSNLNPVTLNKTAKAAISDIVDQSGSFIDPHFKVRQGRQYVAFSESTLDGEDNKKRAEWESNIRKARSKTYRCTVQGYRPIGGSAPVWRTNTLVPLIDDVCKIDEEKLISGVTYRLSPEGRRTDLELIQRNAYNLQLREPITIDEGF